MLSTDVWTSATTSEVCILFRNASIRSIASYNFDTPLASGDTYLINNQNPMTGAWDNVISTAYAIIALSKYLNPSEVLPKQNTSKTNDVKTALRKGVEWLRTQQNPTDKGWCLEGPESPSSVIGTSLVCLALAQLPADLKTADVDQILLSRAENFLLSTQHKSTWWPDYSSDNRANIKATAYACYTLLTVFDYEQNDIRKSIRYIRKKRNTNGSWGKTRKGDVETTSIAMLTLLTAEKRPQPILRRSRTYLLHSNRRDALGFWKNEPNKLGSIWATCYAIYALARYQTETDEHSRLNNFIIGLVSAFIYWLGYLMGKYGWILTIIAIGIILGSSDVVVRVISGITGVIGFISFIIDRVDV